MGGDVLISTQTRKHGFFIMSFDRKLTVLDTLKQYTEADTTDNTPLNMKKRNIEGEFFRSKIMTSHVPKNTWGRILSSPIHQHVPCVGVSSIPQISTTASRKETSSQYFHKREQLASLVSRGSTTMHQATKVSYGVLWKNQSWPRAQDELQIIKLPSKMP